MGASPDCLQTRPGSAYSEVVELTNDCDEAFDLEVEQCPDSADTGEGCLVESGERVGLHARELGLSESEFENGDDFEATIEWSTSEKTKYLLVSGTYDESDTGCTMPKGGCGCAQHHRRSPIGGFLLAGALLGLVRLTPSRRR